MLLILFSVHQCAVVKSHGMLISIHKSKFGSGRNWWIRMLESIASFFAQLTFLSSSKSDIHTFILRSITVVFTHLISTGINFFSIHFLQVHRKWYRTGS